MKSFHDLPDGYQTDGIRRYYDILRKKHTTLVFKRIFDIFFSALLIILLSPAMIIISIVIKCTSRGPVLFLQERVGRYSMPFMICKFRTMRIDAESVGRQITVGERDPRITGIGYFLRRFKLDELPQLFNVFIGQMSFVGTRPEVPRYVDEYTDDMLAVLLLRPGITGYASVRFKDENRLLGLESDPEQAYIKHIIPVKMALDLEYVKEMSVGVDIKTMLTTIKEVF